MPRRRKTPAQAPRQLIYTHLLVGDRKDQIRILTLLPARREIDDIRCTLSTIPLSGVVTTRNNYEALSYAWGASKERRSIYVNGHLVPVTVNLDLALTHLRYHTEARRLWVDAICIDQAHYEEKSLQVSRMRDVFARASAVPVWLGPGDPDTDRAMAYMTRGTADKKRLKAGNDELQSLSSGLQKLLRSSWWTRVWVLQEVVVASGARTLICGHSNMRFQEFNLFCIDAYVLMRILYDDAFFMVRKFVNLVSRFMQPHSSKSRLVLTLLECLEVTRNSKATDARDRVFSLLGLCTGLDTHHLQPDYTKSVSDVYQSATATVLSSRGDLRFLWHTTTQVKREDFPSWCVDSESNHWAYKKFWHPFTYDPHRRGVWYEQQRSGRAGQIVYNPDIDILVLEGVQIDKVTSIVQLPDGQALSKRYWGVPSEHPFAALGPIVIECSLKAEAILMRRLGSDETHHMMAQCVVWRIINAGYPFKHNDLYSVNRRELGLPDDDYWVFEKALQEQSNGVEKYRSLSQSWRVPERYTQLLDNRTPLDLRSYLKPRFVWEILRHMGTTFLGTKRGYIGSSVTPVEEGDIICILFGSHVPAVLRPHGDTGKYSLVSFAYIDGMMETAADRGKTEAMGETERFELV